VIIARTMQYRKDWPYFPMSFKSIAFVMAAVSLAQKWQVPHSALPTLPITSRVDALVGFWPLSTETMRVSVCV